MTRVGAVLRAHDGQSLSRAPSRGSQNKAQTIKWKKKKNEERGIRVRNALDLRMTLCYTIRYRTYRLHRLG